MNPVVGLMGQARAGKDTFAARLVEEHGWTRVAFADALKGAALNLNPRIPAVAPMFIETDTFKSVRDPWSAYPAMPLRYYVDTWGWEEAKKHPEVRGILQRLGVALREVDPDIWVRAGLYKINHAASPVVVTDVRFPNEITELRKQGAWMVRIDRPGLPDADGHVSEWAWRDADVDVVVTNDGRVDDLWLQADQLASEVAGETHFGIRQVWDRVLQD